jgi:maltooligosyltrehalose trehalohydrolase
MEPLADGWWAHDDLALGDGDRYGFAIDDDPAVLPDPRSRRQPDGVHGPSAVFDAGQHRWADSGWRGRELAGRVVYELHVGTFTPEGTLDSAVARLDHLAELGIDFVELLPVNAFNGTHNWGYDGVLWFAVQETYGGPPAYQRFVDRCHERGLAVIQDVVYNHLGPSGNYLPRYGPYLHDGTSNTWGDSVNFAEPEVRRYVLDNAHMWFADYHVDGLRLDAVHAIVDHSPVHILAELAAATAEWSGALGRPLTLIAESDLNDPVMITPRSDGGYGLDAQWSDDFHHSVHVAFTGETMGYYADFEHLDALAKVVTKGFFHDGTFSSFRGRNHGLPLDLDATPAWRLVVASQNHDQIGNRAAGDRLTASLDEGQLAIAAVLTLGGGFTPMLFMGEEWGASTPWQFFTSHPEPELGRMTAEGRFAEFAKMGWDRSVVPDPQSPSTFTNSKLDWTERDTGRHARLLELYHRLIELRHRLPALVDPAMTNVSCEYDEHRRWFVIDRGDVTTVVNFAIDPVTVDRTGRVLLATDKTTAMTDDGIVLPGHAAAIIDRGNARS